MALDVTGSMTEYTPVGGQRKIDALKKSFRQLRREAASRAHAGRPQGARRRGALFVRRQHGLVRQARLRQPQPRQLRDRAHGRGGNSDRRSARDPTSRCTRINRRTRTTPRAGRTTPAPSAEIIPLTDDRALLTRTVDGYRASGSTGGHIGVQWAWNLISEDWGRLLGRRQPARSRTRRPKATSRS